jgi:hypothetical protein
VSGDLGWTHPYACHMPDRRLHEPVRPEKPYVPSLLTDGENSFGFIAEPVPLLSYLRCRHVHASGERCEARRLKDGLCSWHEPMVREFSKWLGDRALYFTGPADAPDARPCGFDRDRAKWA